MKAVQYPGVVLLVLVAAFAATPAAWSSGGTQGLHPFQKPDSGGRPDVVDVTSPSKLLDQHLQTQYSMRWFDKTKAAILKMYRKVDTIETALEGKGRDTDSGKLARMKERFRIITRQMPKREGFVQTIQNMVTYRNQSLKKHVAQLRTMAQEIDEFEQKYSADLDALAQNQGQGGQPGAEQAAGGGTWDRSGLELYYLGNTNKDVDFTINGKSGMEVGDTHPLAKADEVVVVALVDWGEIFRKGMQAKHGSAPSYSGNRTTFNYKVTLADHSTGETRWEVVDEKYTWFPTASRTGMKWSEKDSGHDKARRNEITFMVPRAMKIKARVTAEATWKTTYKTHGRPMERKQTVEATATFAVSPK